ncbi:MAG TPA: hypothetical protein PLU24_00485 [Candidatus Omnitrophota bacterium]|nr:hypothetical protein [Candidatus Omnitrophota bacterium]
MKFISTRGFLFLFVVFISLGVFSVEASDPVVVELHYQNGIKFYKRGLYDRAIQEFEKTLSLDPEHKEAKDYLEKVKEDKSKLTRVDAKKSTAAGLESLYKEGKKRYAQGDYEGAKEIFADILQLKPIDDYASYYKERSEIMISKKMAREKKLEDKKRKVQEAKEKKEKARVAAQQKKTEKEEMLEKRRSINEERRRLKEEKISTAKEAAVEREVAGLRTSERFALPAEESSSLKEEQMPEKEKTVKEIAREEKIRLKNERIEQIKAKKQEEREARLKARQEKIDQKNAAREEKIAAKKAAREEKLRAQREKRTRIKEERSSSTALENKALFLKGVEEYGRRDYDAAIASFEELIQIESSGRKLYTSSAKRLIEKARKKKEAPVRIEASDVANTAEDVVQPKETEGLVTQ